MPPPPILRNGLFTTGNLDNIDHNPSSSTSKDSFHGTALSVTQHPTSGNPGVLREHPQTELHCRSRTVKPLPETHSTVRPTSLPQTAISPPVTDEKAIPTCEYIAGDDSQCNWLKTVHGALTNENDTNYASMNISWSPYFANLQASVPKPPAITALLPLFQDNAHSPAMVKHGMDIIKQVTEHINPGQTPILTVDQPVYALAKKIQWTWPTVYGEDRYVVLMGGLHIEMNVLSLLGDWLEGSGWMHAMTAANVTTEGRALGLQKGSQTSRGQWAHQVSAAALFILLHKSYAEYQTTMPDEETVAFVEWCSQMSTQHPQFHYWYTVLQLEILFLQFMREQRERLFHLYIESLGKIIPWMFALDHYHYARRLTVHVKDMLALEDTCPSTHTQFVNSNFVTHNTRHKFSALAHAQVHKQLNAMVKGDGGAIGIIDNELALRRWMVGGPELARIICEYQESSNMNTGKSEKHHEQIPNTQKAFLTQMRDVVLVVEELGNPFLDMTADLYTLDTKVVMSNEVIESVRSAEDMGKVQYQTFVKDRINNNGTPFNDTIQKICLPLFNSNSEKVQAKTSSKVSNLKTDVQLFSRMYIACQSRDGDLDTFFEHENHAWPPSLASNDKMNQTAKSDLVGVLGSLAPISEHIPDIDVKLIDGAALVHCLDPKRSRYRVKTFQEYAQLVFLPHLALMLQDVARLDVVWDIDQKDSLK